MKKIWILWGMWPQASLHFYEMLIDKSKHYKKNLKNQDYPNIILLNIPVPDLIDSKKDESIVIQMVRREVQNLEKSGVSIILMTCNTMHLFQRNILQWINTPFLSMIDGVINKVQKSGIKKIWLLWSATTMTSWLYETPLDKAWIVTIIPDDTYHENISDIIKKYISGTLFEEDIDTLNQYCEMLINKWAEWIILWCTELPLIMKNFEKKYNLYSSSEILADEVLEYYYKI